MTIQFPEVLHYGDEKVAMSANPLDTWVTMRGPAFAFDRELSTALRRGYRGRWEIVDGRLYLVSLYGALQDGREASLGDVFPDFPVRVFAHWYSGTLVIPKGPVLDFAYLGCGPAHARELLLVIERGVVTATRVRRNRAPKSGPRKPIPRTFRREMVRWAMNPPVFRVKPADLREALTEREIEARELVEDPLNAVPALPFGHLNPAWRDFVAGRPKGSALWSFSKRWKIWLNQTEIRAGYAIVEDGMPVAWILSECRQIPGRRIFQ